MSIRSITIEESTAEQRRAFAKNFLNLDIPADASDDQISGHIERAQPGVATIFIQEADAPAAETEIEQLTDEQKAAATKLNLRPEELGRPGAGTLGQGDPRAVIHIPVVETDDKTGSQDVLVGVNGRAWQLRRGVDLNVPWRVVENLNNAVATQVRHEADPLNPQDVNVVVRDAHRFAFQFVSKPSDEAIRKWHEETDALFCA